MFAGTPIMDIRDLSKYSVFPGIPGTHELDKAYIHPGSSSPYGQANLPTGLSNPRPVTDMNKTEPFVPDYS